MRVLEALKILEAAVIECKTRDVTTPEVREALDVLEPYCQPEWRVAGFREQLKRSEEFGPSGEGQQQSLRTYFSGIHSCVRMLLSEQIGKLQYCYRKKNDAAVKAEIGSPQNLRHYQRGGSLSNGYFIPRARFKARSVIKTCAKPLCRDLTNLALTALGQYYCTRSCRFHYMPQPYNMRLERVCL